MQYFHDPIIKVPKPLGLSFVSINEALGKCPIETDSPFISQSRTVRDLQDGKVKDSLRLLFNTYFPFLGNDSLRLVWCHRSDMARYSSLNGVFTANICLNAGAYSEGHLLQVMTERHIALNDHESPDTVLLSQGSAFIMDADAWHSFRPYNQLTARSTDLLIILQADVDWRWFVPEHAINVKKHWIIGDILRVAKANAAGQQYHPPQPLPEPMVKHADIYNRDISPASTAGGY